MLTIQDSENKPLSTSAIFNVNMTSCITAKFIINEFSDLKDVSTDTKIMIICALQGAIL